MKKIYGIVILFAVIIFSCTKDHNSPSNPVACFTIDANENTDSTHNFLFDQCPPAYDLSYWDFGDGQYSSNPNPEHIYHHYGSYNVTLKVTNTEGKTSTASRTINIGHYALDKIIINKVNNNIPFPKSFIFSCRNASYNGVYTWSISLGAVTTFPYTVNNVHDTFDTLDYDNNPSYLYQGFEWTSSQMTDTIPFHISNSDISSNNYDINKSTFYSGDTTKFTIHFKNIPR